MVGKVVVLTVGGFVAGVLHLSFRLGSIDVFHCYDYLTGKFSININAFHYRYAAKIENKMMH